LPEGKQKKKAQEPCAASAGDDDRKNILQAFLPILHLFFLSYL